MSAAFLTETVLALIESAKKTRSADVFPLIADALEDAGFGDRQASGWPAEKYPEKTVLQCLRRRENVEIFTRYLTTEERAALAEIGLGEAKGLGVRADGVLVYSMAYHGGQYNPAGLKEGDLVTVSGAGWECEYDLAAFIARRKTEMEVAESARNSRTADDLLNSEKATALLDELIATGRAYSHRTDAWARRPVVRDAVARRIASTRGQSA
jgi:hypothetical protein